MKKIVVFFILIIGACQLRAQQSFFVKPADSLLNNTDKYLKIKPGDQFHLFQPNLNLNEILSKVNISAVDHTPVIALAGNSKMQVAKIGGYYTMPVKRIGSEEASPGNENFLFGVPMFKKP
jgi:hypothetical protein